MNTFACSVKKQYPNGPAHTVEEDLELLKEKGIIVPNDQKALHYLNIISYHRFFEYSLAFKTSPENFKTGTTFDSVLTLYDFDSQLRTLIMEALERIEVSLRTAISNTMSETYNPHWYMNSELFRESKFFDFSKDEIKKNVNNKRSKNRAIVEYYNNYDSPNLPPSEIVAEITSFGFWSKVFSNLNAGDEKKICNRLLGDNNFNFQVIISWSRSLTDLRNICAHHERLWNHKMGANMPKIPHQYPQFKQIQTTLYFRLFIIQIFLNKILPDSTWKHTLRKLVEQHDSQINLDIKKTMGFPNNWEDQPFWNFRLSQKHLY
jgi:abortive infection bacteriophage resistance protein